MKKKITHILANVIPIILMIALIPFITNDYMLALVYLIIIAVALALKCEKMDFLFLILGFFVMIASEYFFISTGVEVFQRQTLLNAMPIWLPVLWAYGFVVMKRSVKILEN